MEVRNRLVSEKRPFPGAVFDLPAPPPTLGGLKVMKVSQKGATAKVSYFGKIDFGIGGDPTENLMVLAFINHQGRWMYDKAEFVNLAALPDVRKELAAGQTKYLDEVPEANASGVVPRTPVAVPPAKYIAKVYVYCPGRKVDMQVNQISRHEFINTRGAEIVLGGAKDGRNVVTYRVQKLPEGQGNEPIAVRVYLMSEIPGTKPIKAFERLAKEGEPVKDIETGTFIIDAATAAKLIR